jgi:hypothetical protein
MLALGKVGQCFFADGGEMSFAPHKSLVARNQPMQSMVGQ